MSTARDTKPRPGVTPEELAEHLLKMLKAQYERGTITERRPIPLSEILNLWNGAPGNRFRRIDTRIFMEAHTVLHDRGTPIGGNCATGYYYKDPTKELGY
jgi:hypothetical protein